MRLVTGRGAAQAREGGSAGPKMHGGAFQSIGSALYKPWLLWISVSGQLLMVLLANSNPSDAVAQYLYESTTVASRSRPVIRVY